MSGTLVLFSVISPKLRIASKYFIDEEFILSKLYHSFCRELHMLLCLPTGLIMSQIPFSRTFFLITRKNQSIWFSSYLGFTIFYCKTCVLVHALTLILGRLKFQASLSCIASICIKKREERKRIPEEQEDQVLGFFFLWFYYCPI